MTAIPVASYPQQTRVGILHVARNKAHDKPYPWFVGSIRIRAVNDRALVQGQLSRTQHHVHCLRLIDRNFDTFATAIQHVRIGRILVVQQAQLVRTGNHPHATICFVTRCKGNPGRRRWRQVQARVKTVLVPRRVTRIVRLLGKDEGSVNQNIVAKNCFNHVEQRVVSNDLVRPVKEEMKTIETFW